MRPFVRREAVNLALTAVFVLCLALPFLGLWRRDEANSEKRDLARFPDLAHWRDVKPLTRDIEAFVGDRFGFRQPLLSMKSWLDYHLFGVSASPSVIVGRDGWLFYTADDSLADIEHEVSMEAEDRNAWTTTIRGRGDWLAGRNIAYRLVVAPDKHTVYPDALPARFRSAGLSRLDQIVEALGPSPYLVDLRPALQAFRRSSDLPLYFKTDTHWNGIGAYAAFQAIMRSIGRGPDTPLMTLRPMDFRPSGVTGDMDLALMARLSLPEPLYAADLAGASKCVETTPYDLPAQWPAGEDFPGFQTRCATGRGTVLIFHDSFGDGLFDYLAPQFAHAVYLDGRPSDLQFAVMVGQIKPDLVLEERVERYFSMVPKPDLDAAIAEATKP